MQVFEPKSRYATREDNDPTISTQRHHPCKHCGKAGHAHDKERVYHDGGLYSYNYFCPEEDDE